MARAQPSLVPLQDLALGVPARVAEIRGGRQLVRRLMALGVRVGSEIRVLQHRGSGLVVSLGDTRVALGGGVVDKLSVEPLTRHAVPEAS